MKFEGTTKEMYQAFRFIKGNYTKKQLENVNLAIEATKDKVTLISVSDEAYYRTEVKGVTVLEAGIMQADFAFIETLSDRFNATPIEVIGYDETLYAFVDEIERVDGTGFEVEMALDALQPLAIVGYEDTTSLLTELLSSTTKTARDFTDTLLLRLRKNQLNGRAISMQTIVTSSIQVETDNQGMVDMYLTKTQAQTINKAIKLMDKKQPFTILKGEEQLGFSSNGDAVVLLHKTADIGMPDITQLMKRCASLNPEQAVRVDIAAWKKELTQLQKDTAEEDRDTLRQGLAIDGTLTNQPEEAHVFIDVKATLKLFRAIPAKQVNLSFFDQAIVFCYETDTRRHSSVLMTGKE